MSNIVRQGQGNEIVAELQSVLTAVQAVDGNTDGIEAALASQITELQALNATDFASETTLAAQKAVIDNVLLELQAIDVNTDGLEALLTSLDGKDFATSAKQDAIIAALGGGDVSVSNNSVVAQSATSVSLLAANTDRVEFTIRNNAQGNQKLYLSLGSAATTGSIIELGKGDIYINDSKYTGEIFGIWDGAGSGEAVINELATA